MKLLIPAGFMLSVVSGHVAITLCSGFAPVTKADTSPMQTAMPMQMPMAMAGPASDPGAMDMAAMPGHDPAKDHGKTEMPCAFSGLSTHALASVDPLLLGAAIAFVMGIALRPSPPRARSATLYLRPPLRGPPIAL